MTAHQLAPGADRSPPRTTHPAGPSMRSSRFNPHRTKGPARPPRPAPGPRRPVRRGNQPRPQKAKADAAKRVRQRHVKVKPGNFKIRIRDVTIIRKGYRYASR